MLLSRFFLDAAPPVAVGKVLDSVLFSFLAELFLEASDVEGYGGFLVSLNWKLDEKFCKNCFYGWDERFSDSSKDSSLSSCTLDLNDSNN